MSARSAPAVLDLQDAQRPSQLKARMTSVRLAVLLILLVYSGLSAYSGNFLPLRLVKGDSMEPTLAAGDVILLKSVPFSAIGDGDIVAYKAPAAAEAGNGPGTILHRVQRTGVQNGSKVLFTKGDNSTADPWPVSSDLVQGELVLRVPWVGTPVLFLTSKRGIIFISIAVLISLLYIPAMVMFHMTVLRKGEGVRKVPRRSVLPAEPGDVPQADFAGISTPETEGVVFDARLSRSYAAGPSSHSTAMELSGGRDSLIGPVVNAVDGLVAEQAQIRQSILELSDSVSNYAVHLKSHTSAVEALAGVAQALERSVKRQEALMERQESRAQIEDTAESGPEELGRTGDRGTFLKRGPLFGKTDGPL